MQDLNDMLFFAEVVERGGFAAAGRSLGVPKSRLSRRLAGLEAAVGARLLQRTTRRVVLTEAGEVFYRHCRALRETAEAASEALATLQAEPMGLLRVVCPVTLSQTVVGQMVPRFLLRHPKVQLQMEVNNRVVDLLEDGVDVALRVRPSLEASGSLVVKRLGLGRSVLVAAPSLLARHGPLAGPDDLAGLPSLAMSSTDGRALWLLEGPDGAPLSVVHRPRYVADDLLSLQFAAVAGVGACQLPDYLCADDLAQGRLVRVLPDWPSPPVIVHAVFPSRRGLLPVVRAFLDFLAEAFEQTPDSVFQYSEIDSKQRPADDGLLPMEG